MGKRRKLQRIISKWIKSDLPEESTSVLLLGVTRIPTSPLPSRRPCSLQIPIPIPNNDSKQSTEKREEEKPRDLETDDELNENQKSKSGQKKERTFVRSRFSVTISPDDPLLEEYYRELRKQAHSNKKREANLQHQQRNENRLLKTQSLIVNNHHHKKENKEKDDEWKRPVCSAAASAAALKDAFINDNNNDRRLSLVVNGHELFDDGKNEYSSSKIVPLKRDSFDLETIPEETRIITLYKLNFEDENEKTFQPLAVDPVILSTNNNPQISISSGNSTAMDRSVDSIGACSLNCDASVELSEASDVSSSGTLRSFGIPTPTPSPEQKLPSYLSLACTVNGYSTTTNYDRDRLSRSRDASPHRLPESNQDNLATYSIQNNLLSPPNLVPLPIIAHRSRKMDTTNKENMSEHTITHQYFSSKSVTYITSKETKSFSSLITNQHDVVDACLENGLKNDANITYSMKNMSMMSKKCGGESQEVKSECKSFIEQRVERLYGPGALAQGFFVSKRMKNRPSESEDKASSTPVKYSTSSSSNNYTTTIDDNSNNMKQSNSSPALPVLRHLRPEFRAQLPILTPKKESPMHKSSTTPVLKQQQEPVKCVINGSSLNGHAHAHIDSNKTNCNISKSNGVKEIDQLMIQTPEKSNAECVVKDGHYFMKILDTEAKRLLEMADKVENELNTTENLPEEAKGYLRSASGKARLLVSQKMQQFKGLCTNNITQVEGEAFPTTNEDLQGFWDMVMLQVDQIDNLFKEIEILKANNWEEKKPDVVDKPTNGTKMVKKASQARPLSANAEKARKEREAQRKAMIEAKRKAMREAKQAQQAQGIEIFVPESS